MIKIVISERGKKKRVITVDKDTVVIGRISKNDVVLPKPNVSKHHARLKVEGDRLLIEDLDSTNGTYVNGERITEARELGVTDKFFIGDFVLKAKIEIDKGQESALPEQMDKDIEEVQAEELEEVEILEEDNLPPPPDEDELELVIEDEVPEEPTGSMELPETPEPESKIESPVEVPQHMEEPSGEFTDKIASASLKVRMDAEEENLQEYQAVLTRVADRAEKDVFKGQVGAGKEISDEEWSYYSDRLMQIVESMRRTNEIPRNIDPYVLSQDVLAEYTSYGPLEEVMSDETVRGIHVTGCTRIFVLRKYKWERLPKVFSSVSALTRIMAKLVKKANIKDVSARRYLRGRMDDGTLLQILLPPLVQKHTIVLEKGHVSTLTLADMVKAKVIDAKVVKLLETAIKHNENILICGPKHSGKTEILNACLPLLPLDANLVLLQDRDELSPPHINMVLLNKEALGAEPTREAFILESMGPDWVVIEDLEMNDVRVMLELAVSGRQAIIATSAAVDFHTCMDKLLLELTMLYPALTHADRLRMLYSTLDMVISLTRAPGGKPMATRVTRITLNNGSPHQEVLFGE